MSKWDKEKKQVLEATREMLTKGLVVGTLGNISRRLSTGDDNILIAINPSGIAYDSMKAEDIQIVDSQGKTVEGNLPPSTETQMHLAIYKNRQNISAVIHTHAVYASAVSITDSGIPPIMIDQIALLGGEIRLAEHTISGNREQVDHVLAALENRNAALLPNHGAVGIGRTIREAFTACEVIEKTAKIYILARLSGEVKQLPPQILEIMQAVFSQTQDR